MKKEVRERIEAAHKKPRRKGSHPGTGGGYRVGSGRKDKEIDIEQLYKLAAYACTDSEMADILGVSRETFGRRKRSTKIYTLELKRFDRELQDRVVDRVITGTFAEIIEVGNSSAKLRVRQSQFKIMEAGGSGAASMAIHLGRHLLGQRDVVAVADPDDPNAKGPSTVLIKLMRGDEDL